jgi:hypothetical protein
MDFATTIRIGRRVYRVTGTVQHWGPDKGEFDIKTVDGFCFRGRWYDMTPKLESYAMGLLADAYDFELSN